MHHFTVSNYNLGYSSQQRSNIGDGSSYLHHFKMPFTVLEMVHIHQYIWLLFEQNHVTNNHEEQAKCTVEWVKCTVEGGL